MFFSYLGLCCVFFLSRSKLIFWTANAEHKHKFVDKIFLLCPLMIISLEGAKVKGCQWFHLLRSLPKFPKSHLTQPRGPLVEKLPSYQHLIKVDPVHLQFGQTLCRCGYSWKPYTDMDYAMNAVKDLLILILNS